MPAVQDAVMRSQSGMAALHGFQRSQSAQGVMQRARIAPHSRTIAGISHPDGTGPNISTLTWAGIIVVIAGVGAAGRSITAQMMCIAPSSAIGIALENG
jgi:hypothetical protein